MSKIFLTSSESQTRLPYESPMFVVNHLNTPLSLLTSLSLADAEFEDLEDLGEW